MNIMIQERKQAGVERLRMHPVRIRRQTFHSK
jgi:hypothetical protein